MPEKLNPLWVATEPGVREVAGTCAETGRFALDTEADSLHSYFHKVCLVQVTVDGRHAVIDPLALGSADLDPLWNVVADAGTTVVMHGADYDIRVLDRDYGARVRGLEDTQIMAQLLGEEKTGLAHLLHQEFDIELDKKHQRADWGRRPLSADQLEYAAADTAHLIELADRLRGRLVDLGRWPWALEEFDRLTQVRHEPSVPDPLAFERIKGAKKLRGKARDRLFDLFLWRDGEAQRLDLPPFKVLGNRPMLELAESPPESSADLARVPGLGQRFVRRWGTKVLRHLERPKSAPPPLRRARLPGPSSLERRRLDALTAARDTVAAELGLQPGLVAPKALLRAVAEADGLGEIGMGSGLAGWRLEVLRKPFTAAMKGVE